MNWFIFEALHFCGLHSSKVLRVIRYMVSLKVNVSFECMDKILYFYMIYYENCTFHGTNTLMYSGNLWNMSLEILLGWLNYFKRIFACAI